MVWDCIFWVQNCICKSSNTNIWMMLGQGVALFQTFVNRFIDGKQVKNSHSRHLQGFSFVELELVIYNMKQLFKMSSQASKRQKRHTETNLNNKKFATTPTLPNPQPPPPNISQPPSDPGPAKHLALKLRVQGIEF